MATAWGRGLQPCAANTPPRASVQHMSCLMQRQASFCLPVRSADTQHGADPAPAPTQHKSPLGQGRMAARFHTAKHGVHVQTWPSDLAIEPGQELRWNLWFHPRSPQPLLAPLSWCYEADRSATDGPRQRCVRCSPGFMHCYGADLNAYTDVAVAVDESICL